MCVQKEGNTSSRYLQPPMRVRDSQRDSWVASKLYSQIASYLRSVAACACVCA